MKHQRGRPEMVEGKREIRYTIRFTKEENEKLIESVNELGISIADYLRSRGINGFAHVVNGKSLIAELDKIGAELGRSGNNINQLAKHANVLMKRDMVGDSVTSRFNALFDEYIKVQRAMEVVLRKLIREGRR